MFAVQLYSVRAQSYPRANKSYPLELLRSTATLGESERGSSQGAVLLYTLLWHQSFFFIRLGNTLHVVFLARRHFRNWCEFLYIVVRELLIACSTLWAWERRSIIKVIVIQACGLGSEILQSTGTSNQHTYPHIGSVCICAHVTRARTKVSYPFSEAGAGLLMGRY